MDLFVSPHQCHVKFYHCAARALLGAKICCWSICQPSGGISDEISVIPVIPLPLTLSLHLKIETANICPMNVALWPIVITLSWSLKALDFRSNPKCNEFQHNKKIWRETDKGVHGIQKTRVIVCSRINLSTNLMLRLVEVKIKWSQASNNGEI